MPSIPKGDMFQSPGVGRSWPYPGWQHGKQSTLKGFCPERCSCASNRAGPDIPAWLRSLVAAESPSATTSHQPRKPDPKNRDRCRNRDWDRNRSVGPPGPRHARQWGRFETAPQPSQPRSNDSRPITERAAQPNHLHLSTPPLPRPPKPLLPRRSRRSRKARRAASHSPI